MRASSVRAIPEWWPNSACLTAFPAHEYAWGEHLESAQRELVGFCEALLCRPGSEPIELLVPDARIEAQARAMLERCAPRVRFTRMDYGDVWLRDTSPIFVLREDGSHATVRFAFNGWGGKYLYPHDDRLAEQVAARHAHAPSRSFDVIMEGGAVELDGLGTCLTTVSCLLNPNRALAEHDSPEAQRAAVEQALEQALGAHKVVWLKAGLAGDHTDGHIDNLARFVAEGTLVHMRGSDADDPNTDALAQIEDELRQARDARGEPFTLLPIPSPGRVLAKDGSVMAASYCNFYLGNEVVVMPAFDTAHDEPARRALARIFPRHEVRMSAARNFLEGGGTFHCMTRQIPRPGSTP